MAKEDEEEDKAWAREDGKQAFLTLSQVPAANLQAANAVGSP